MASSTAMKSITTAACLAVAGLASAGTAPVTMVSGVTNPGVDVSLTIQASSTAGYDYDFVISNNSASGIITGVYFEAAWSSLLAGQGLSTGPADLNGGSVEPDIAGWTDSLSSFQVGTTRVRKWVGRGYADYYYDTLSDGIYAGQSQTFSFLADGLTLSDLESMLAGAGFNVGIRMQALTTDQYAEGWGLAGAIETAQPVQEEPQVPTGVPTPSAALAGMALLGLTGLRRRRNG